MKIEKLLNNTEIIPYYLAETKNTLNIPQWKQTEIENRIKQLDNSEQELIDYNEFRIELIS